jgi:hypothetical protein
MNKDMIFQFRITLKDIEPTIWRRIQVPKSYNFWDLHVAIQDAMGWFDYHLHAFRIENPETNEIDEIGIPDEEDFESNPPCHPGWEVPIFQYFQEPGTKSEYGYDFGDGWEHEIIFETRVIKHKDQKYPICIDGERACPPEDCGGAFGYTELLKTLKNPDDEEYESIIQWLGGSFDPEDFNHEEVEFDDPKKRFSQAFGDL